MRVPLNWKNVTAWTMTLVEKHGRRPDFERVGALRSGCMISGFEGRWRGA